MAGYGRVLTDGWCRLLTANGIWTWYWENPNWGFMFIEFVGIADGAFGCAWYEVLVMTTGSIIEECYAKRI